MTKRFSCADKETLIAYVYDECDPQSRLEVEQHLAACPSCVEEVAGFGGVRDALAGWMPTTAPGFRIVRDEADGQQARVLRPARWWRAPLPAWAKAAAAVLLFAGGAALANLDVRYQDGGVVIRTGWHQPAQAVATAIGAPAAQPSPVVATPPVSPTPWRTDLAALERQLRDDFSRQLSAVRAATPPQQRLASAPVNEDRMMQRVQALLEESEQRQQRELTYRVGLVQTEMAKQRRADLLRVQEGLSQFPARVGSSEWLQQRQLINYVLTGSQKK